MKDKFPPKWTKQDEAMFSEFWSVLPSQSKVGKVYAKGCWKRAGVEKSDMEHILVAIEKLKASRQWFNGFAPQASTIINQRRWTDADEMDAPQAVKSPATCLSCGMLREAHNRLSPTEVKIAKEIGMKLACDSFASE